MSTMFPNSLEIGDSDVNGMTDIVCLGIGLVAMVILPEHAKSIVTACNAHDQLMSFLSDIDLIDHPEAGDHNPLCQGGDENATVVDAIIARARCLKAAITAGATQ